MYKINIILNAGWPVPHLVHKMRVILTCPVLKIQAQKVWPAGLWLDTFFLKISYDKAFKCSTNWKTLTSS